MTTVEALRRRLTQPIGKTEAAVEPAAAESPAAGRTEERSRRSRPTLPGASLNRQRLQVGLDIGSSAVRAVELSIGRGRPTVTRFGQVGLPPRSVVEGEIVDADAVGRAIRTLWSETGLSTSAVVVGVSSQRVMVREADVPAMSEAEFRQALQFEAADLIPIPVDDAVMDFRILNGQAPASGDGRPQMRILLAAAHSSTIDAHMAAARAGGLSPIAIGVGGLALVRSLGLDEADGDDAHAIVDVGADLTTVAVAARGELRFVRVLAGGGASYTKLLASTTGCELSEAEARKRRGQEPEGGLPSDDALIGQIAATLDYFASQIGTGSIQQVVLSGGGSQYEPFVRQLTDRLRWTLAQSAPLAAFELPASGLGGIDIARAQAVAQTAAGLAAWKGRADSSKINLLPAEVLAARQQRRALTAMVGAGLGMAVVLAGAWYLQDRHVQDVRNQTAQIAASTAAERAAVARLQPVEGYQQAVASRAGLVTTTEKGDVDIHGLLDVIGAHLPAGINLTSIQATIGSSTPTSATPPSPASGTSSTSDTGLGTVNMSLSGKGSAATVASFLRDMAGVPALSGVVVPSETASGGVVTFSATANLTDKAPMAQRKDT